MFISLFSFLFFGVLIVIVPLDVRYGDFVGFTLGVFGVFYWPGSVYMVVHSVFSRLSQDINRAEVSGEE